MIFSAARRFGLLPAPLAAVAVLAVMSIDDAVPARAAIAFPPPAQLTADCTAGANLTPPYLQIVTDANGDEFAAWSCEDVQGTSVVTQEAMLPAGGSWSTPVTLSTDSNYSLSVGIDGNGDGLIAWQEFSADRSYSQIEAAVIAPDGSVTSQTTLSQSGLSSYYPSVAVNAEGDAVVGWMGWNGPDATATQTAPFTAIGSLSGGFQSPVALDSYGGGPLYDSASGAVVLAMDSGGDAAAAWCRGGGHCSSAISQSGGAFSSATAFPSDGGSVDDEASVAMDQNGNVTIAWRRYGGNSAPSAVYAAQEPLTGGFSTAQQLSPASDDAEDPVMASDPSGDAVVAWIDFSVSGLPVEAATLQGGTSSFQPWFQVGNEGDAGSNIFAAVDATGIATVTWTDQTASCGCPPYPPTYSASFSTAAPTPARPMVRGSNLVSGSSSEPIVVSQLPAGATVPASAGGPGGSIGVIWASPKKSHQAVFVSTGKQLRYQPDAQIKRGNDKSYLGLGVFNTTGASQTRSTSEHPGHSATFDLKLVNAVLRSDTLALKGCSSSPGFTVRYLSGSTDVTATVTAGTYRTATLAPAASQTLKLTIAVSSTASAGTTETCQVTASSVTQPKRKDLVAAKVKVSAG